MAYLSRQGPRMEVFVGLLIVLVTILEGSEGIRCYNKSSGSDELSDNDIANCPSDQPCAISLQGDTVIRRLCVPVVGLDKDCMNKSFGDPPCFNVNSQWDASKFENCTKDTTDNTLPKPGSLYWGPVPEVDKACVCFKELCNDHSFDPPKENSTDLPIASGPYSTPNGQVILAILVAAAALQNFEIWAGSF